MTRHFPVSFNEWQSGVHTAYDFQAILEAKLDAGMSLTREEEHLLKTARKTTARYDINGRRKPARYTDERA